MKDTTLLWIAGIGVALYVAYQYLQGNCVAGDTGLPCSLYFDIAGQPPAVAVPVASATPSAVSSSSTSTGVSTPAQVVSPPATPSQTPYGGWSNSRMPREIIIFGQGNPARIANSVINQTPLPGNVAPATTSS